MPKDKQKHFYQIAKATAAHMGYELDEETDVYLKKLIEDGTGSLEYYIGRYPEARNHFIEEGCLSMVNAVAMTVSESKHSSEGKAVISLKSVSSVKVRIEETKTEDLRCRPWCRKGFTNF